MCVSNVQPRQRGDYRDLFTTRQTFLTRPLGIVYRVPVPTRNGWEKTQFPLSSHRPGIQSQIAFLALYSHPGRSSPTLRGKALREVFLCSIAKAHAVEGIPIMIAGNGGGRIRTGFHLDGKADPITRVGLTLQQALGVQVDRWGALSMDTKRSISELLA